MVSIYKKIDLTIQRQKSKDMYITRTALNYLVTRATNRVPAGSDTGYLKEAEEPLESVLDSSFQIVPGTIIMEWSVSDRVQECRAFQIEWGRKARAIRGHNGCHRSSNR